jgi:hypothetical protein
MLQFTRINNADIIPVKLIEQVKENPDVKRFYNYMSLAVQSPTCLLYALIDEEHCIQGYLWCEVQLLSEELFVNTYSVYPEYRERNDVLEIAVSYIKRLAKELKLKKICWMSDCHRTFKSMGFEESSQKIFEYEV